MKQVIIHVYGIQFDRDINLSRYFQHTRKEIIEKYNQELERRQKGGKANVEIWFINSTSGKPGIDVELRTDSTVLPGLLFTEPTTQQMIKKKLRSWCHRGIIKFFIGSPMTDITQR